MNVYLIRHGDAEKSSITKKDSERDLTQQGKTVTRNAAIYWKRIISDFDYIISSPYTRAFQTAEIINEVFESHTDIIKDKRLSPGSRPDDVIEILQSYTFKNIAIMGHQPDLSDIISVFISGSGAYVEIKKSSIARISFGTKVKAGKGIMEYLIPADIFSVK